MKFLILVLSVMLIIGCGKLEYSEVMTEPVEVVETVYTPSRHGTGVSPVINMTGGGGTSIAVVSVNLPEKHAVVFKCAHGKFIVDRKDVWEVSLVGKKGVAHYREVYKIIDNTPHLIKYDFIKVVYNERG